MFLVLLLVLLVLIESALQDVQGGVDLLFHDDRQVRGGLRLHDVGAGGLKALELVGGVLVNG